MALWSVWVIVCETQQTIENEENEESVLLEEAACDRGTSDDLSAEVSPIVIQSHMQNNLST